MTRVVCWSCRTEDRDPGDPLAGRRCAACGAPGQLVRLQPVPSNLHVAILGGAVGAALGAAFMGLGGAIAGAMTGVLVGASLTRR